MTAIVVVLVAGALSYLFRVSMLVFGARGLPPVLDRAAQYGVPVVFAALAAGALVPYATFDAAAVAPFAAVAAGAIMARRTGSSSAALLAGMPVMLIVTSVVAS